MLVRGHLSFAIAAAALAFSGASPADVWYVDKSNDSNTEDGTSWATAFSTIQPAIDAAHQDGGGEVWIAAGVYDERREYIPPLSFSSSGRNYGSLLLREHVELYGGFVGSETRRVQRKVTRNRTVIDGSTARDGEYASAVVVGASHATIDGLTITHGGGYGGMLNKDIQNIRITNCVFAENLSSFGGMYNENATDILVERCTFSDNWGSSTGAIASLDSTLEVLDSTFVGNQTTAISAIVMNSATRARFVRCSFRNNLDAAPLGHGGGGEEGVLGLEVIECDFVGNDIGSGVIIFGSDGAGFVLERTTFIGNRESHRGSVGVYISAQPNAAQLVAATIANCAFVNNSHTPLYLRSVNLDLRGSTFVGNVDSYFRENIFATNVYYDRPLQSRILVSNSIFWNDENTREFSSEIEESGRLVIENSIVRGGYDGVGIIDERPSFRNQPDGDFRLLPHSVGVDIADVATALDLDLFGAPRSQGLGPDMGAHEVRVVNPTLCEASPGIEAALGRLRFVAELYGDLDDDGLPEIASLRLLSAAACAYDSSKGFAAERAFELNLDAVDDEPFDMRILRKREVIAALMAVGEETQRVVRDAFAEEGVVLLGRYSVVVCDETGECEAIELDPTFRGTVDSMTGMDEPFPGPGDYDLDGLTNSQEWAGVVAQGGGLDEFILAATDPSIRATVVSASSDGCFIATAAYGTPLAGEIDALRALRDQHLLTNTFGAAFTDIYYRLSPPLADIVAEREGLRAAVRLVLGTGLTILGSLQESLLGMLLLGVALKTLRARRGHEN